MVVLGSTGSIGKNTLLLAQKFSSQIEAISCKQNYKLLNEQIAKFRPKFVHIYDENLKNFVDHDRVFVGERGILDMIDSCKSDLVVNALVGFSGFFPSLHTQKLGKKLALANKESLVVGGKFLDTKSINAIDSEHFGLKFLLKERPRIAKLIITASGGAFYNTPLSELKNVSAKEALKHPNWSMGAKITTDSATMTNKLFEILEAYWLYGVKNIDAFIERSSLIHALIEFIDGSTTAHFSKTDMKLAIYHAIFGDRDERILEPVELPNLEAIKFEKINLDKYPVFTLKDEILKNPDLGVVINAANDLSVQAFLDGKCGFLDISRSIFEALNKFGDLKITTTDDILRIHEQITKYINQKLKRIKF